MNAEKIREIIARYHCNTDAAFAIGFKDLNSGTYIAADDATPYPAASYFKVFLLAELFRQAETGEVHLDNRISFPKEYFCEGSGLLKLLHGGIEVTLRDLAILMMTVSDNSAADYLLNLLGKDCIRKNVLEALGLKESRVDYNCRELISRYFECGERTLAEQYPDFSKVELRNAENFHCTGGPNLQSSARDAVKLLELLHQGQWVNEAASQGCLEIMKLCQTNLRIPRYLPNGLPIAHKTGTIDRVAVDCGIVYTAKGDYVLAMFYNGNLASAVGYKKNHNGSLGDDTMAELSLEIYQAYMEEVI